MTKRNLLLRASLLTISALIVMAGAMPQVASAQAKSKPTTIDVRGTWSGSFFSRHSNVAPFTMTVVINPDARGHLIGTSSMSSECLKDVQLQVTVNGSEVVLAGSDDSGNNITVRAILDSNGTNLKGSYILNGSATGKCETDGGTGNLGKR